MLSELFRLIVLKEPFAYTIGEKVVAEAEKLRHRKFKGYHHRVNAYRKMYWKLQKTLDRLPYLGSGEYEPYMLIADGQLRGELYLFEEKLAKLDPKGPEAQRIRKREQNDIDVDTV